MKKKGFTLIELIVVIAIIGVLAAILVPAMLGYVRKSKITTANTTAKSIYNAFNTALVDLDTTDSSPAKLDDISGASGAAYASGDELQKSVYGYFNDITKCTNFSVHFEEGAAVSCGVINGKYPGAYPNAWDVQGFKDAGSNVTSADTAMAGPKKTTTT